LTGVDGRINASSEVNREELGRLPNWDDLAVLETHFLAPFAALCAAFWHALKPPFFQEPLFNLYLGARRLKAAPYFFEYAEGLRFAFLAGASFFEDEPEDEDPLSRAASRRRITSSMLVNQPPQLSAAVDWSAMAMTSFWLRVMTLHLMRTVTFTSRVALVDNVDSPRT